jgi:hypothetical protein
MVEGVRGEGVRGDGKRKGGKKKEGGWMGQGGTKANVFPKRFVYTRRKGLLLRIAFLKKSRLFWAKMALASLVAISGPKKSKFSGPIPYHGPCNGFACIKIITVFVLEFISCLSPIQSGKGSFFPSFFELF